MRLLLQRVSSASVSIENQTHASINRGLLLFIGIEEADDFSEIEWLANKVLKMRIFEDQNGRMNQSIQDINGDLLAISQFTLFASTKKGNRPSFLQSAKPIISQPLYDQFCDQLERLFPSKVKRGVFGANMQISLINDGPVTIWLDSKNRE